MNSEHVNCRNIRISMELSRGGNRAGRAGLGLAKTGPGQNRAWPKLAWFFGAKILTAQPVLKTGPVGPNSHFKAKKIRAGRAGPGHTGLGHTGPGQIRPGFFRAKNLMAQPGPNFERTGLAHRAGPILPHLELSKELRFRCSWTLWKPHRVKNSSVYRLLKI